MILPLHGRGLLAQEVVLQRSVLLGKACTGLVDCAVFGQKPGNAAMSATVLSEESLLLLACVWGLTAAVVCDLELPTAPCKSARHLPERPTWSSMRLSLSTGDLMMFSMFLQMKQQGGHARMWMQ